MFGMRVVQKTSFFLTAIAGALMLWVGSLAFQQSDLSVASVLSAQPSGIGPVQIMGVLSSMIGMAGALSLVGADFARYAKSPKDVRIMAIGGNIIVNFGVVSLGALLYQAGDTVVARFLADPANSDVAAAQLGGTIFEKVQYLAHSNPGAYFIILGGIVGFLVMYAAQIKAQVINTYSDPSPCPTCSTRFSEEAPPHSDGRPRQRDRSCFRVGQHPGRLRLLPRPPGYSLPRACRTVIADFYILRKRQPDQTAIVERFNWAGTYRPGRRIGEAISPGLRDSNLPLWASSSPSCSPRCCT